MQDQDAKPVDLHGLFVDRVKSLLDDVIAELTGAERAGWRYEDLDSIHMLATALAEISERHRAQVTGASPKTEPEPEPEPTPKPEPEVSRPTLWQVPVRPKATPRPKPPKYRTVPERILSLFDDGAVLDANQVRIRLGLTYIPSRYLLNLYSTGELDRVEEVSPAGRPYYIYAKSFRASAI